MDNCTAQESWRGRQVVKDTMVLFPINGNPNSLNSACVSCMCVGPSPPDHGSGTVVFAAADPPGSMCGCPLSWSGLLKPRLTSRQYTYGYNAHKTAIVAQTASSLLLGNGCCGSVSHSNCAAGVWREKSGSQGCSAEAPHSPNRRPEGLSVCPGPGIWFVCASESRAAWLFGVIKYQNLRIWNVLNIHYLCSNETANNCLINQSSNESNYSFLSIITQLRFTGYNFPWKVNFYLEKKKPERLFGLKPKMSD